MIEGGAWAPLLLQWPVWSDHWSRRKPILSETVRAVCLARVVRKRDGPRELCVALLKAPGVSDVVSFVSVETGEVVEVPVWDYWLWPDGGNFQVPSVEGVGG